MKKTVAYIYLWIHLPSNKWYIGSKSAKGCHPSQHEKYICSKLTVKKDVMENRQNWYYDIVCTGEPEFIRKLETRILVTLNARDDPTSFNEGNACWNPGNRIGSKDTDITRKKKSLARVGSNNPMWNRRGINSPHFGKKHSKETTDKQSAGIKVYAKSRPESHNLAISKALTGNLKLSERMRGDKNPSFGKPASQFNKQMSTLKNSGNKNPMKKMHNQIGCVFCKKTVAKNHFTMFHGQKCKMANI